MCVCVCVCVCACACVRACVHACVCVYGVHMHVCNCVDQYWSSPDKLELQYFLIWRSPGRLASLFVSFKWPGKEAIGRCALTS